MIRRELLALGLSNQAAASDAQQRIVRLVVIRGREIRLIGRHQRQTFGIGELDQPGLGAPLLLNAMALQLDVEPITEQLCQTVTARGR